MNLSGEFSGLADCAWLGAGETHKQSKYGVFPLSSHIPDVGLPQPDSIGIR